MITAVPAVITNTIVIILGQVVSGIIGKLHPLNRRPGVLATAIKPVDCRIDSPIVK
jgi:hypothetical protein